MDIRSAYGLNSVGLKGELRLRADGLGERVFLNFCSMTLRKAAVRGSELLSVQSRLSLLAFRARRPGVFTGVNPGDLTTNGYQLM